MISRVANSKTRSMLPVIDRRVGEEQAAWFGQPRTPPPATRPGERLPALIVGHVGRPPGRADRAARSARFDRVAGRGGRCTTRCQRSRRGRHWRWAGVDSVVRTSARTAHLHSPNKVGLHQRFGSTVGGGRPRATIVTKGRCSEEPGKRAITSPRSGQGSRRCGVVLAESMAGRGSGANIAWPSGHLGWILSESPARFRSGVNRRLCWAQRTTTGEKWLAP